MAKSLQEPAIEDEFRKYALRPVGEIILVHHKIELLAEVHYYVWNVLVLAS